MLSVRGICTICTALMLGSFVSSSVAFSTSGFSAAGLSHNTKRSVITCTPPLRAGSNQGLQATVMAASHIKLDSARARGLALQLDDGTRKSHSMAENTAFVTGFFKGISNRESFGALVASLYFVYEAMEAAFDETAEESVQAMDFPSLRRVGALEQDMEFFFGSDWKQRVRPSPETAKYVARIRTVAGTKPVLLVAHQYTRYLGDLFGGQMMSGMAVRSLGLSGDQGVSFYHFADIPDNKQFVEEWYAAVNALPLSEAQKQEIVDEANVVFDHNIRILQELDSKSWGAYMAMAKLAYLGIAEKIWGREAVAV